MRHILNIAMIITLIPSVLKYAIENDIAPENGFSILLVGVFFIAGGRPILQIFAAISALYLFAKEVSGGLQTDLVFGHLLLLCIVMVGFYIMFSSIFRKRKTNK